MYEQTAHAIPMNSSATMTHGGKRATPGARRWIVRGSRRGADRTASNRDMRTSTFCACPHLVRLEPMSLRGGSACHIAHEGAGAHRLVRAVALGSPQPG